MTTCPPTYSGAFAGMAEADLRAALASAQQALLAISLGNKGVTFSYAQGNGTRTVTNAETNPGTIRALIQELKRALGMPGGRRRPLRMLYR